MRQVTVYVKSVKTLVGKKGFERRVPLRKLGGGPNRTEIEGKVTNGTFVLKTYETVAEPEYKFVLSEDQQKTVELIEEVASEYGVEVKVVDVTQESILRRAIQREFEKIKTFPALVTDSGKIHKGGMTREQLEALLSINSKK